MAVRSRLARKEEARRRRRNLVFTILTFLIIIFVFFWGIPTLVKVATFFAEWRGSESPVEIGDDLPPAPPQINLPPRATNKDSIPISGSAEPGATVEIFLNGLSSQKVVTTSEGSFSIEKLKLSLGENKIYAVVIDKAGNISQPSSEISILYDNKPPELEVETPKNGASFFGEKQKKVTVSGKTEPGVTLTINDHLVILNQEGNFSAQINLSEGENTIKIVAKDLAENQTEKEIKVNFSP